MSTKVDSERREQTVADRIDRAKATLRFEQDVLRGFVENEPVTVTAQRNGVSRQTVWRTRKWLGLERGGRHDNIASIEAVRPEVA